MIKSNRTYITPPFSFPSLHPFISHFPFPFPSLLLLLFLQYLQYILHHLPPSPADSKSHAHFLLPVAVAVAVAVHVDVLVVVLDPAPLFGVGGGVDFVGGDGGGGFVFDFLGEDEVEEDGEEGGYCGGCYVFSEGVGFVIFWEAF